MTAGVRSSASFSPGTNFSTITFVVLLSPPQPPPHPLHRFAPAAACRSPRQPRLAGGHKLDTFAGAACACVLSSVRDRENAPVCLCARIGACPAPSGHCCSPRLLHASRLMSSFSVKNIYCSVFTTDMIQQQQQQQQLSLAAL